ncbi:hypothetical protein AFCDBAGC_1066 [Methylobacterium cerastii]|uniref:Uncharacterized protein n=1 Tax=Methylobacterium cerastii TaxID=932741 RepID=A0ABQ4QDM6_9HYPH|nr:MULTISPECIES: hypothetical protein [Methylobacterium]TXN13679.1 hypothetical protein FV219_04600 [Methylobacterium sp. WL122]TXM66756.1 hypothetical protein FV229_11945 [Methylobacterium sp. WL120]TXM71430.1 hypothetical protein FV226_15320 [Methylobacterium sp. WL12]TXN01118.1 hypothetical protein FV222_11020 [Methylobacterium sp. WL103]TXN82200.1 hypothetical protein FV234_10840 [Methylobacterium sp. WL8]
MTRKELLTRLEAVQTALGERAHTSFNSSIFGDAALLKRIEAFEAQLVAVEKPKVADYTGNMFTRIANRRNAEAVQKRAQS